MYTEGEFQEPSKDQILKELTEAVNQLKQVEQENLKPDLQKNCWMSYKVSSIPLFDKQAKWLSKKYPSLKKDLSEGIENLAEAP